MRKSSQAQQNTFFLFEPVARYFALLIKPAGVLVESYKNTRVFYSLSARRHRRSQGIKIKQSRQLVCWVINLEDFIETY